MNIAIISSWHVHAEEYANAFAAIYLNTLLLPAYRCKNPDAIGDIWVITAVFPNGTYCRLPFKMGTFRR